MFRHKLLLHCLFFFPLFTNGQFPECNFQQFSKQNGLTNDESNYFISEDSDGFIWIGSLNGFYRYDGLKFKHFRLTVNPQDTFSSDQVIQSNFWEDLEGNLWFSTYNSLHCFNKKSQKTENYSAPDIRNSYHVFHFEKPQNRLWLRAGNTLWTFELNTKQWQLEIEQSEGIRFRVITDNNDAVQTVFAASWLKGPLEIHRKNKSDKWESSTYLKTNFSIRSIAHLDKTVVWLATDLGLVEYDFEAQKILNQYAQTNQGSSLNLFDINHLLDSPFLLLASDHKGLFLFDTESRSIIKNWSSKTEEDHLHLPNEPRAIFQNKEGDVWIGLKKGGVIHSNSAISSPISIKPVNISIDKILKKDKNNIWLLTANGKIHEYNINMNKLYSVSNPSAKTTIKHIETDRSNQLWAITSSQVFKRNADNNLAWELVVQSDELSFVSIYFSYDNRILLVTQKGIYDLVHENQSYHLSPSLEFKNFNKYDFFHFLPINDHHIAIPHQSRNLWLAEIKEKEILIKDRISLEADTYTILPASLNDTIWIGTNLGLFYIYQNQIKQIDQLTEFEVYFIIKGEKSLLWLITNHGVISYNHRNHELIHFLSENIEFSKYAALQTQNGKIWLGTDQGLVVFHPDSVKTDFPRPKAHIEALWVNNVPYETDYAISEMPQLELNYLENTLAFELRAVGFYQPENSRLRYRLEGYDNSEVNIENGGFARFTQIPPGEYTLLITPLNAHGQAGVAKRLPIRIRPPFWQTLWFKILSVLTGLLLIIGIVGAYYRRKLQQQKRLLEKQEALNEERNRIAKELHDDMGSSLSSILYLSDDLLIDVEGKETEHEVKRIGELAVSSLENMREIIWAMDTSNNSFHDLSQRLQKLIENLLSDNKLDFTLDFPVAPHNPTLGIALRRNIYLIVKESLHNTIKHAQANHVKIALQLQDQHIHLSVQDDGVGFDQQALQEQGYGLNNMQERAAAINAQLIISSKPNEGTQLKLSVSW